MPMGYDRAIRGNIAPIAFITDKMSLGGIGRMMAAPWLDAYAKVHRA